MTGTLAQLITLTTYGNNFLKNNTSPADFESYTSFNFCNKVDFRLVKYNKESEKWDEQVIADSPSDWLIHLKSTGCLALRLYFEHSSDQGMAQDHKLAGMVGGGGTWLIEEIYEAYANYWANRWEVTNQDAPDRKIWTVNYGQTISKQPITNLQLDTEAVKRKLLIVLSNISAFAHKKQFENWAQQFDKAKTILSSAKPEEGCYYTDLIPLNNYSLTAKQLLFTSAAAWVFGGMGSWNDIGFDNENDQLTYDNLSAQLYAMLNESVIAGVNSF